MKMISPSNLEVDVGATLGPNEYIGMCRREVFDDYLRKRAEGHGTNLINGLFMKLDTPATDNDFYTLHYNKYEPGKKVGVPSKLEVDVVIGSDGANSRVAAQIDAGEYDYAIAFQERIRINDSQMEYYKDLAEMYVGDDVSPDFYGWVFPKYDHVAVGTGTVINKPAIKDYQTATRDRAAQRIEGGSIIRVEAHPIPEHPRPRRVQVLKRTKTRKAKIRVPLPLFLSPLVYFLCQIEREGGGAGGGEDFMICVYAYMMERRGFPAGSL